MSIFISIVMIGTIGIKSYSYNCHFSETSTLEDICHKDDRNSCCPDDESDIEGCCKKETKVYQAKFDSFNSFQIEIPFLGNSELSYVFHFSQQRCSEKSIIENFNKAPPSLSGRQRLVLHQIFRI